VSHMTTDMFVCRNHSPDFSSFMTYHWVCSKSQGTGVTCVAGTVYHLGVPEFTPGFFGEVRVARTIVFCVVFCRVLFVIVSLFIWPLHCISFALRLLITLLVSSHFSLSITMSNPDLLALGALRSLTRISQHVFPL
jgi:hypothetical protein